MGTFSFEQVLRQKAYAVCAASQDALAKLDNVGGEDTILERRSHAAMRLGEVTTYICLAAPQV